MAKCPQCHAVFELADSFDASRTSGRSKPSEAPLPWGMIAAPNGDGLVITRRWFHRKHLWIALVAAFWDGGMLYYLAPIVSTGRWPALLPLSLYLAAGTFLAYYALALLLNRTTITIGGNNITVHHGPLPWPGRRLARATINRLFCKEQVQSQRNGSPSYTYEVHAATGEGQRLKLVGGLDEPEQALYLEQAIEHHLGIADRRQPGEMRW